jgi:hypothetical protein
MQPLTIFPNRSKLVLYFFGCVAMAALFAWGLFEPGVSTRFTVRIAAWIGFPFVAYVALYLLFRIAMPMPSIVIDANGIYDNASIFSVGMLNWREVDSAVVFTVRGQKMIGILLKDNERFINRFGLIRRGIYRLILLLGSPIVAFPESLVSMKAEQLAENISQFRRCS